MQFCVWNVGCELLVRQAMRLGPNVVPRGLEPRTLRLLAIRSNQLSYETLFESKVCFHEKIFNFDPRKLDLVTWDDLRYT